jgi:hypothetical protein
MTTTPNYFVLFADMLGFKQLVLQHKVPFPENLEFRGRLYERPERENPAAAKGNALSRAFRAFHRTANDCLTRIVWHEPVSVIVFSDSLFIATTSAEDCIAFAEQMMLVGLHRDMPLRMGLGLGSFVRYGFAYEDDPLVRYSSAQFFGSAVVYAVEAEGSIKGIRGAVHPAAAQALLQLVPNRLVSLPESQVSSHSSHELNYVPEHPDPMGDLQSETEITAKIRRLSSAAPDLPSVKIHYTEALDALARMANAAGRTSAAQQERAAQESTESAVDRGD